MNKERYLKLKKLFKKENINGSFLIKILSKVENQLDGIDEIQKIFPRHIEEVVLSGFYSFPDYELCRYIIGIHNFNMLFINDSEKRKYEDNIEYENNLVNQVIENVKLYKYGGFTFRRNQINPDRFIYFPILHDLYVIFSKITEILTQNSNSKIKDINLALIGKISNAGLGVCTLIESGFLDESYALCRTIIELFLILKCINKNKGVLNKYYKFLNLEEDYSKNRFFSQEFLQLFDNRKNKKQKDEFSYLHFGWVDELNNYHKVVSKKPYSVSGLFEYLKKYNNEDEKILDSLEYIYKNCHAFAHGSLKSFINNSISLITITMALSFPTVHIYQAICTQFKVSTQINEVDVVSKLIKNYNLSVEKYNKYTN